MKFARILLSTRGWEEKMRGFCRFSVRYSFSDMVRAGLRLRAAASGAFVC